MPPQENNILPENNPVTESDSFQQKSTCGYAFLTTLTILLILTGVFGVWYFLNPLPDDESETVAVVNKFADWKTYRNEEYGFEVKYPNSWTTEDNQNGVYFISPDTKTFIDQDKTNCSSGQKEFGCVTNDMEFKNISNLKNAYSVKKENINGIDFSAYIDYTLANTHYFETNKDNKIYSFNFVNEKNESILREILSTFKFIK